jgi:Fic family protein
MNYNWQQPDWPLFRYDLADIQDELFSIAAKMGHMSGILKGLPESMQTETVLDLMVSEAVKTSEIEGEILSRADVMSSIRNQLALNVPPQAVRDPRATGAAELMMDVRRTFAEPLSKEKLFAWHNMLLSTRTEHMRVGAWRNHAEPMQVVSGSIGKTKVHFEALPSKQVAKEMKAFIQWFNNTGPGGTQEIKLAAVRSAITHVYFESIHPFEDGNGRIGRALSEKALSQGLGYPVLLSLSKTIEANKKKYYAALQQAQRSNDITPWITYFVHTVLDAQIDAETQIDFVLKKTRFFDRHVSQLDARQTKVIRRMLEEGPQGFAGGLNAKKYIGITGVSKATATRDLQYLHDIGILQRVGAGRSTRYVLVF